MEKGTQFTIFPRRLKMVHLLTSTFEKKMKVNIFRVEREAGIPVEVLSKEIIEPFDESSLNCWDNMLELIKN